MMSENDFLFSDKIDGATFSGYDTNSSIVPIILNEFQPERVVFTSKLVGSFLTDLGKNLLKGTGILESKLAGGIVQSIGSNTENAIAEMVSRNPNNLYDLNASAWKMPNPMKAILEMFPNGRWLNVYELPFFGSEYLKADQYTNWETGDLSQKLGDDANKFAKERIKY